MIGSAAAAGLAARFAAGFAADVVALGLGDFAKSGFPLLAASGSVGSGTRIKPIPERAAFATPFGQNEPFVDTYANAVNQSGFRFAGAAGFPSAIRKRPAHRRAFLGWE
jgi:hypothetical protein